MSNTDRQLDDYRSFPKGLQDKGVDHPYQECPGGQEGVNIVQTEDMDIDLMLGHYEYQNFTDQVIDSNSNQDEVDKDQLNYFKIQKENGQEFVNLKNANQINESESLNMDAPKSR